MEEKKILQLSKEEVFTRGLHKRGVSYRGCFISDVRAAKDNDISENILKYPYRIETFFLLICTRGEGAINVNLQEYKISSNTIFFNHPNSIVQVSQKNSDTQGVVLAFDEQMAREMNFDIKLILPVALALKGCPVLSIQEEQCNQLTGLLKNIVQEIQSSKDEPFHDEIVRNYFRLFFYKLSSVMTLNLQARGGVSVSVEGSVKNRNEEYFQKFMTVLAENYKRERSLGFYAAQLCITPKYLTTLIKRVSGRSAAEWIDQYVILEAKNLLRYSTMSIQEVAYELNFPNQSFFGKYFKHHTGYSPSAYKLLK